MRYFFFILLFAFLQHSAVSQTASVFTGNKTATYQEVIAHYSGLAKKHPEAQLMTYGTTDAGYPLHLFVLSTEQSKENKCVVLVNNGIHPGEPCGVDASMLLADVLLKDKNNLEQILSNTTLCIIPTYNVGGSLNRGCCSRANQDGPEMYGFRGNAKNLDLNRDFIKADAQNTHAFVQLFREWDPDVFIDTHTSNGADYQYTMTLIASQADKLHPMVGDYLKEQMLPDLYNSMQDVGHEMSPYVHSVASIPDSGIVDFYDSPRYSTGYTALFNTIGFVTEAHMLKPFESRVNATYSFLLEMLRIVSRDSEQIIEARDKANEDVKAQTTFPLHWKMDSSAYKWINFKGFEALYKKSNVTGADRLYYDQTQPYEKKIKHYDRFIPILKVEKPVYYVIPQAWQEVISRLEMNKVILQRLEKDMEIEVSTYSIKDLQTSPRPYEGHYVHKGVELEMSSQKITFRKGDYIIPMNQTSNRYIVETLEPNSPDAFFAWNFFDEILQQKEWFSSYVFEDLAEEILASNPELKAELEKRRASDEAFAKNSFAQLYFVYRHSQYFEQSYQRYPVYRIEKEMTLPTESN